MSRKIIGVTVGTPISPSTVKEKMKLASEDWVKESFQPKGEYLTEVPEGYAKTSDIPTKPGDIGAQPAGNYLTDIPAGYATETFVTEKIAEAEMGGGGSGENGATFTPHVDDDGNLSWSNDKGLKNPETVNIKGETQEVRIYNAVLESGSATRYGVTIKGPEICDENGICTSNSGTVWDGADGKPGASMYTFDPDNALSGDVVVDSSFINVPEGSSIKNYDLLLAPNGDVYLYTPKISGGVILSKKVTFLFSIKGSNYVLTEADKVEIAEMSAELVDVPESGGDVDLTGYAKEDWVQENYQPKGNYLTKVPEDYAKTSDIPTKTSQLQNDSGYLTQHQDISGKLDASKLPEAINTALAQAKASGEFDGKDGDDGVSATHSWNGTVLTITSASGTSSADLKGRDGDDGKTPVRGTDYWTAADIAEIKSYVDDAILGGAW